MTTIQLSEEEFREGSNDYEGRCLACGETAYGVEPDARKYECECCGEPRVYGLEELLMMGRVEITT